VSKKDRLEKDYKDFNNAIENAAQSELKKIHEETNALKEEAQKTSKAVEESINEQANAGKKKS
jgi:hypothetical protein